MNGPKYSKSRGDLIDKLEKDLLSRASTLQNKLARLSIEYLNSLDSDDDGLKNTVTNNNALNRLDRFIRENISEDVKRFVKWLYNALKSIGSVNAKYFGQFGTDTDTVDKEIEKVIKSLGLTMSDEGDIKVQKDSFVSGLTDLTEPTKRVKTTIRGGIVGTAISVALLKRSINTKVKGARRLGLIESKFNSEALETFVRVDAVVGREVAKAVGLRAAVYSGGVITTSRSFCRQRNGKVFTYDEIEAFRDLSWPEKPDIYDPFTDPIGGHKCRHKWDHISDELAKILRPELKDIL